MSGQFQAPSENQFVKPDFTAPLDVAAILKQIPDSITLKGAFVDSIEKMVVELPNWREELYRGMPHQQYATFKNYPRHEIMQLEVRAAQMKYPNAPLRQALRLGGQTVYPQMLSTIVGKMIMAALGNDLNTLFRVVPRTMHMFLNFAHIASYQVADRHWLMHFKDYYSYIDCGEVGIMEGMVMHYKCQPDIRICPVSTFEIWYDIRW